MYILKLLSYDVYKCTLLWVVHKQHCHYSWLISCNFELSDLSLWGIAGGRT